MSMAAVVADDWAGAGSEAVEIAAKGMRSSERKDGKKIYMCDGGETQLKNVTYGGAKRVPIA